MQMARRENRNLVHVCTEYPPLFCGIPDGEMSTTQFIHLGRLGGGLFGVDGGFRGGGFRDGLAPLLSSPPLPRPEAPPPAEFAGAGADSDGVGGAGSAGGGAANASSFCRLCAKYRLNASASFA